MNFLVSLLISSLAVLIAAYLVPGVVVASFLTSIAVALVLGLLNTLVRPILLLLTLPINILTLGLFTLVISVIIIYMAAAIVPGFRVDNFLSALLFGLILSLVGWFLQTLT